MILAIYSNRKWKYKMCNIAIQYLLMSGSISCHILKLHPNSTCCTSIPWRLKSCCIKVLLNLLISTYYNRVSTHWYMCLHTTWSRSWTSFKLGQMSHKIMDLYHTHVQMYFWWQTFHEIYFVMNIWHWTLKNVSII